MRVTLRDIIDVLRHYELADGDTTTQAINVQTTKHPTEGVTDIAFIYRRNKYHLYIDNTALEDSDYIKSAINDAKPADSFTVLQPTEGMAISVFFKGKDAYLVQVGATVSRLDAELARRYPDISRSLWQKYIKSEYVTVNGNVVTQPKTEVTDTDEIAVSLPEMTDYTDHSLPIIYSDDNVIVVDKPAGVLTHSKAADNDEFTVAEFFARYSSFNKDTNKAGIVHRLDRDTSGVIIGARTEQTGLYLQKQFANRQVKKTYYAVVEGLPKELTAIIDIPLGRNPSAPGTYRPDASGKSAQTSYEVIETNGKQSLIKLQPLTGRTHQLRVHMQYINTPIKGDRVYGKPSDRMYLHAHELIISTKHDHVQTFTSPVPDIFTDIFPKK
ncbi:MAG: hypothetical protein JWN33_426 [Candidatus Saccharibacteria bacterium]|nr:hypothetical protein [Candidatus Saccharibacteria bacterium]